MSFNNIPSPSPSTSSPSAKEESVSPQMLATDTGLGLDPSDPLNLWLHNTAQGSDGMMEEELPGGEPPDWTQLADLWTPSIEQNTKIDFGLDSEMDFVNSMAIDPNALQLNYPDFAMNELQYPFTFQPDGVVSQPSDETPPHRERKLSVTSSSSSSRASFSAVESPSSSSEASQEKTQPLDPAVELAQRVLQSAGFTLAVAANGQAAASNAQASYIPPGHHSQLIVSSPRFSSSASSVSSAPSTPPPSTPPQTTLSLASSLKQIQQAQAASMGIMPRPKTSHTTIERRYRTNLNARITSLRMAVPALRVLEDKDTSNVGGGGKKGKNSTLGKVTFGTQVKKETEDGTDVIDVIDERGFVDGVRVARKCSKANILGKAVEYIKVLKKREARLKREQDGLKQLVRGLVGGPGLLQEWEREWNVKFGGAERDEVEGDDDEGASDDEGGSGDDDDDDETGRKRKKPKLTSQPKKEPKEKKPTPPPPQPQMLPDGTVVMPEKRKRGRPRKVQSSAPTPGSQTFTFTSSLQTQPPPQTAQPQQYLLAVFALFSFFNSPFSSSSTSSNHSHTGTVLTHNNTHHLAHGWTLHNVIQIFHLMVSVLVFCSFALPWMPSRKYFSLSYLSSLRASYRARVFPRTSEARSGLLRSALSKRGSPDEAAVLHDALTGGFSLRSLFGVVRKDKNSTYQQQGLEQSAWVRLGEICVLQEETSLLKRAMTFWHMRAHLNWFTSSAADLSTLALVLYPLCTVARRPARALWESARARKGYTGDKGRGVGVLIRTHERLVLESLELDEALQLLKSLPPTSRLTHSPIGALADMLIKERSRKHLQKAFVRTVSPPEKSFEHEENTADVFESVKAGQTEELEVRATIEAAHSFGGKLAKIGDMLESLWNIGGVHELDLELEKEAEEAGLDGEICALAVSIVLYRRIFSSSITGPLGDGNGCTVSILLSPPPSPMRRDSRLYLTLRKALGSSVFESEAGIDFGRALEDARDRVVDMLVESERANR